MKLTDMQNLPDRLLELDPLASHTLNKVFGHFASVPFSLDQLQRLAEPIAGGADLALGLKHLVEAGFVLAVKKTWGDRLYYMPLDLFLQLQQEKHAALPFKPGGPFSYSQEQDNLEARARIRLTHPVKPGLADDLFRALSRMARGNLPLTAKGTVPKQALDKFTASLGITDQDVHRLGLCYPGQDVYPPKAAVILDMALSLNLAKRGPKAWEIREPELQGWLAMTREQMDARLLHQLLERYVPAAPGLLQGACSLLLPCFQEGEWYSCNKLVQQLLVSGVKSPADEKAGDQWLTAWLTALCAFGWAELGVSEEKEDEMFFRWVRKPLLHGITVARGSAPAIGENSFGAARTIVVQPDYELLVLPETPYTLRWELELCCELVSSDVLTTYRMTRQAVKAAFAKGRTPAELLTLLEQHAAAGIPEQIRLDLMQWNQELGRIKLERMMLLQCTDLEAAERIAEAAGLSPLLKRLGPLVFAVPETDVKVVRQELLKLSLELPEGGVDEKETASYPRPEVMQDAALQGGHSQAAFPDSTSHFKPAGWIQLGTAVSLYQPDESFPETDELFPGLEFIPRSWTKELRSYHNSTVRQLLERALTWKARIELEAGGRTYTGLLQSLTGGENWLTQVTINTLDLENASFEFSWKDVDKARIVLPDF